MPYLIAGTLIVIAVGAAIMSNSGRDTSTIGIIQSLHNER